MMKLAKAGVFAEEQASIVAANIAALIHGEKAEHTYSGKAVCYLETGDGMASVIPGEYYAYPEPRVSIEAPSVEGHRAKEQFEKPVTTWFEHKDVENAGRRRRSRKNEEDGSRESVGVC
jgi:sulfide:quinone oxidoreductase